MALDLAAICNKAAILAFDVAGTAIMSPVTYHNMANPATYSPTTGVTQTDTNITARMLMEAAQDQPVEGSLIRAGFTGKVKATVITSELGMTPKSNDYVTWSGVKRIIESVQQGDPTGAIYEMILGEPL